MKPGDLIVSDTTGALEGSIWITDDGKFDDFAITGWSYDLGTLGVVVATVDSKIRNPHAIYVITPAVIGWDAPICWKRVVSHEPG